MTSIPSTDKNLSALVLSREKGGIMVSIDHKYTIVKPEDLVRKATELATDMKIERLVE